VEAITCPACGTAAEPRQWACSSCGRSLGDGPEADPDLPPLRCTSCGGPTVRGFLSLRTGGTSGGVGLLFGQLAEAGEQPINLRTETCSQCGHLDLFWA
jgi:DNA-directed RNA polymerase subunit RPC12/RpoP